MSRRGDKLKEGTLWQRNCAEVISTLGDYVDLQVADIRTDLPDNTAIVAGTYTPTLTGVANVAASTPYSCQYARVGSVVTVSGRVDVDPTAATTTQLGISLPVASNLANANECAGAGNSVNVVIPAAIYGDATNNRAEMAWVATDTANQAVYFTFTYRII